MIQQDVQLDEKDLLVELSSGPFKLFIDLLREQFPTVSTEVQQTVIQLLFHVVLSYRLFLATQLKKVPDDAVFLRGAVVRRDRYSNTRGGEFVAQLKRLSAALSMMSWTRGDDDFFRKAFTRFESPQDVDVAFYCPTTSLDAAKDWWIVVRRMFGIKELTRVRVGTSTFVEHGTCSVAGSSVQVVWEEREHSGGLRHAYLYIFDSSQERKPLFILDIALALNNAHDTRFGVSAQIRDLYLKYNLFPRANGQLVVSPDKTSPFSEPRFDTPTLFAILSDPEEAVSSSLRGMVDGLLWPPVESTINSDNGLGMTSHQADMLRIALNPYNISPAVIEKSTRRNDEILKDMIRLLLLQEPNKLLHMLLECRMFRYFPNFCAFIGYSFTKETQAVAYWDREKDIGFAVADQMLEKIRDGIDKRKLHTIVTFILSLQRLSKGEKVSLPLSFFTQYLTAKDAQFVELIQSSNNWVSKTETTATEFAILQFLSRMFLPGGKVVDTVIIKKDNNTRV